MCSMIHHLSCIFVVRGSNWADEQQGSVSQLAVGNCQENLTQNHLTDLTDHVVAAFI